MKYTYHTDAVIEKVQTAKGKDGKRLVGTWCVITQPVGGLDHWKLEYMSSQVDSWNWYVRPSAESEFVRLGCDQ